MTETWKPIAGYEEFYLVSNTGRIKSLSRTVNCGRGVLTRPGKELKARPNSRGYLRVQLTKNGHKKALFVHRLVAEAFVSKPESCNIVNHLDFNYQNNRADNLEWTTGNGNVQYSLVRDRYKRTPEMKAAFKKMLDETRGVAVVGTEIKTGKKIKFPVLNDVKKAGFQPSCVCACCKRKRATHGGYTWVYDNG